MHAHDVVWAHQSLDGQNKAVGHGSILKSTIGNLPVPNHVYLLAIEVLLLIVRQRRLADTAAVKREPSEPGLQGR